MARRSDHTQEQIREMAIKASRGIIAQNGFAALTARKVAGEIGYTAGTLYLVFNNLDDMVVHVNAITLDEMYEQLAGTQARCRKPENCILRLGHEYINFALQNWHLWNAVFDHKMPEGQKPPEWFHKKVMKLYDLVEKQLLALGMNRGEGSRLATTALWSGVHGICVLGLNNEFEDSSETTVKKLVDSLITNYLNGIAKVN